MSKRMRSDFPPEADFERVATMIEAFRALKATNPKNYEAQMEQIRRIVNGRTDVSGELGQLSAMDADMILVELNEEVYLPRPSLAGNVPPFRTEIEELLSLREDDCFMGNDDGTFVSLEEVGEDELADALRPAKLPNF